ncbi:MAG: DDE-type integrase/transposase/recombinase, partial [Pseudomonas sp.]
MVQDEGNPHGLVDLVGRGLVPEGPSRLWSTEVAYICMWDGWVYLASVLDGCTWEVVGWSVEGHVCASLVADALVRAVNRQRPASSRWLCTF